MNLKEKSKEAEEILLGVRQKLTYAAENLPDEYQGEAVKLDQMAQRIHEMIRNVRYWKAKP